MNKYRIGAFSYKGCTNFDYFRHLENKVFTAENDAEALKKVERMQHKIENQMIKDGQELNDLDPCLMNYIEREWYFINLSLKQTTFYYAEMVDILINIDNELMNAGHYSSFDKKDKSKLKEYAKKAINNHCPDTLKKYIALNIESNFIDVEY